MEKPKPSAPIDYKNYREWIMKSGSRICTFEVVPRLIPRMPINPKKLTIVLFALIGCWIFLVSWVLAQKPTIVKEVPQHAFSQDAIDAVQDTRIMELTQVVNTHSTELLQLEADRNWLMGGLAMIGGVFVIVQIMQIVSIRKNDKV